VNILKNAYEALPVRAGGLEGRIDVQVAPKGNYVHITVRDSGEGIPAANIDEVRQCLPGRTSKRNIGTGFGLCSARRNIEAHGGRLLIESQENVGTSVTLVLPAIRGERV
jgi:signal transduction histidine kinase